MRMFNIGLSSLKGEAYSRGRRACLGASVLVGAAPLP
jgi:hypothetical protein